MPAGWDRVSAHGVVWGDGTPLAFVVVDNLYVDP